MEGKSGGLGFTSVLFIVFLVLKLTHVIAWSWLWVTSPLWIGFAVAIFVIAIVVLVGLVITRDKK